MIKIYKDEGKVVIVGEESECEACKEAIEFMIEEKKVIQSLEKFHVPSKLLGSVIGQHFSNVNRIDSTYNVQVIKFLCHRRLRRNNLKFGRKGHRS